MAPAFGDRWSDRSRRSFSRRVKTFWSFVDDTDPKGCWPWLGPHRGSYGTYPIVNMMLPAHKALLMYLDIEVPEPLVPDHLCEIKRCVSPNHLEVVTQSQNSIRVHRREAHERRTPTISAEIPENWMLWRRQKEIRENRAREGWEPPLLVEGHWTPQYWRAVVIATPPCNCVGCTEDGPGHHRY